MKKLIILLYIMVTSCSSSVYMGNKKRYPNMYSDHQLIYKREGQKLEILLSALQGKTYTLKDGAKFTITKKDTALYFHFIKQATKIIE